MNPVRTAPLTVENGGGNQNDIKGLACHLYELEHWSNDEECQAKTVMRRRLRDMVDQVDCEKFYTGSGAKITRTLKGILNEVLIDKKVVEGHFSEFCRRVGNLYTEVAANAFLMKPYFDRDPGEEDEDCYGDHNSCFFKGGCNQKNGEFIDHSPSTAVVVVEPTTDRYAAGRMVVWIKDSITAHLLNQYSVEGGTELPRNVFARALEALSGAKVTYQQVNSSNGTLPVYVNHGYMRVTAIEGNFDALTTDYRFYCPECGGLFPSEDVHADRDGTSHYIGCCSSCCDEGDRSRYSCNQCGDRLDEDDCHWVNDECYCQRCYERNFFYCDSCSNDYHSDDAVTVHDRLGREQYVCSGCCGEHYVMCEHCEEYFDSDTVATTEDDCPLCKSCYVEETESCKDCGRTWMNAGDELNDHGYCEECAENREEGEEDGICA